MIRQWTLAGMVFQLLVAAAVGDEFALDLRYRKSAGKAAFRVGQKKENWSPRQTAVIVCDMWDYHHCLNATRRVVEMAPRMNKLIEYARSQGATIIHAPSSCMGAYKDHPARLRAAQIAKSKSLPKDIGQWCNRIPSEEGGVYPLDQSDGGEDDDPKEHADWAKKLAKMGRNPRAPWKSQYKKIGIQDIDYISDNGEEIWSIMESRKITNVMLVGVHTNMCVLGRPFGLRQMSKNGKNVVLVRDMTDTMYNPQRWPYVSHFQGTDLIVEHIEKFVCPTITSNQLIGGKVFRFKNDRRRKAVLLIGEKLYKTDKTLPVFADQVLRARLGMDVVRLQASKKDGNQIPGMAKELRDADLVILSMRRRALPAADLNALKDYLTTGKPLLALRTSSHAFDTRGKHPQGHAEWAGFDHEVLGGNYQGHHKAGPLTQATAAGKHALLAGVKLPFTSEGSLYKSKPLAKGATAVLIGKIADQAPEPIAWTHQFGKSRVFYTSLGHESDFRNPAFVRLLENAARWSVGMRVRDK